MEPRKWTKFKDGKPKVNIVFITDFGSTWITDWRAYQDCKNAVDLAWSLIELPEVPQDVKHRCEGEDDKQSKVQWVCYGCEGSLFYENVYDDNMTHSSVSFCPFCGYEAKDV